MKGVSFTKGLAVGLVFAFLGWRIWTYQRAEPKLDINGLDDKSAISFSPSIASTDAAPGIKHGHEGENPPSFPAPPTKPSRPSNPSLKPVGNVIEFQIIDGFAVAFGDILLGKTDGPLPQRVGRYEAPTPLFWDRQEIPYSISSDLPNPERVEKALTYLRQKTPVNFVPYTGQKDAIVFEVGTEHCLSPLGKIGGLQPIKLSQGCQSQEILHEILHSLGFIHEQSRSDRDQYVEILWDNIEEKYQLQFAIAPESFQDPLRTFPFDYHSIMLYRSNEFALRPELLSMKPVKGDAILPTQEGLSDGDIRRINRMFLGHE